MTKIWNAGEKLNASDLNLEFANREIIGAKQSPGYLLGGIYPSALSIFNTLGQGINDGKIKISVDGISYDNIAVDLLLYDSEAERISSVSGSTQMNITFDNSVGQSFTIPAGMGKMTKFQIALSRWGNGATVNVELRIGSDPNSGTVIQSFSVPASYAGGNYDFVLSTPRVVIAGDIFSIRMTSSGGGSDFFYMGANNANPYADGCAYWGYPTLYQRATYDIGFKVFGNNIANHTTATIASAVQSAIRAITGGLEVVAYDTDRYVITSGIKGDKSKILKLMTPSLGTDLSGNGSTKYLDCGISGTEINGSGHTVNMRGILVGGVNPSPISVFNAFGIGANDGKVKMNINGVVYDNVPIDLSNFEASDTDKISQLTDNGNISTSPFDYINQHAQVFTIGTSNIKVSQIKVKIYAYIYNTRTLSIYTGSTPGQGTLVAQASVSGTADLRSGFEVFTFSPPFILQANTTYHFIYSDPGIGHKVPASSSNLYSGGSVWCYVNTSWVNYPGNDSAFVITGKNQIVATLSSVISALQTAIRTATGKLETVEYNNYGYFVIKSSMTGNGSQVLKFMTPSTGTDLSGNGLVKYYDLGNGAQSEFIGYSDYNKIAKLDDNGNIPLAVLPMAYYCKVKLGADPVYSGGTETLMNWSIDEFKTILGFRNNSYPSRIIIPTGLDGYYLAMANAGGDGNSTYPIILSIWKNGTKIESGGGGLTGSYGGAQVCTLINLAGGDYLEIKCYPGNNWQVRGLYSSFSIMKMTN